jgi:hypothetical protein
VIEVVMTSGGINKLEGYRRMAVAEVWFWEDETLTIYQLQHPSSDQKPEGDLSPRPAGEGLEVRADQQSVYQKVQQSVLLPNLSIEILSRYILYHDQFDAVDEFLRECAG